MTVRPLRHSIAYKIVLQNFKIGATFAINPYGRIAIFSIMRTKFYAWLV